MLSFMTTGDSHDLTTIRQHLQEAQEQLNDPDRFEEFKDPVILFRALCIVLHDLKCLIDLVDGEKEKAHGEP